MKANFYVIFLFMLPVTLPAQVSLESLVQIHAVTQAEQDVLVPAAAGSLIFNVDTKHLYVSDGTEWILLVTQAVVKVLTTSYTLTAADNGKVLTMDSASTLNLTIPSGLPVGFSVSVYQLGTGKIVFVSSGTTLKNRLQRFKTAGKDAGVGIVCTSTNVFYLTGDLRR